MVAQRGSTARILQHLQEGRSLTPLEALGVYGVYRLSAVIHRLRRAGYNIITEMRYDPNGKPYAEYRLVHDHARGAALRSRGRAYHRAFA